MFWRITTLGKQRDNLTFLRLILRPGKGYKVGILSHLVFIRLILDFRRQASILIKELLNEVSC